MGVIMCSVLPHVYGESPEAQSQSCSLIMTYMYGTKGDWEQ